MKELRKINKTLNKARIKHNELCDYLRSNELSQDKQSKTVKLMDLEFNVIISCMKKLMILEKESNIFRKNEFLDLARYYFDAKSRDFKDEIIAKIEATNKNFVKVRTLQNSSQNKLHFKYVADRLRTSDYHNLFFNNFSSHLGKQLILRNTKINGYAIELEFIN